MKWLLHSPFPVAFFVTQAACAESSDEGRGSTRTPESGAREVSGEVRLLCLAACLTCLALLRDV